MFLTSHNFSQTPHGFFTRKGGVSGGIYASLNCGQGSGDSQAHVLENRRRVALRLGTTEPLLLSLHQVHGDRVITVDSPWTHAQRPEADAMVTMTPGIALGILTADCVPVLFADSTHGVIGAAHAGWKGQAAGVLERTLEAMLALGAARHDICAAIGPCIGQASYEVGSDLREKLMALDADCEPYFSMGARAGHWFFAIGRCAEARLQKAGIGHLHRLEVDTYTQEDDFFSFRRATHRREPDYGRQISAIMLK